MARPGVESPLQPGQSTGVENDKYRWELTVAPFILTDETIDTRPIPAQLFMVTVKVSWGDEGGSERQFELSELKLTTYCRGKTLSQPGFTLIEVLLAMTLLSVMMTLLFASLKICAESWEQGEKKINEVNEIAAAVNFFQRHLTVAKPFGMILPKKKGCFPFKAKNRRAVCFLFSRERGKVRFAIDFRGVAKGK